MKKVVVRLDLHDDKAKQKALKAVSTLPVGFTFMSLLPVWQQVFDDPCREVVDYMIVPCTNDLIIFLLLSFICLFSIYSLCFPAGIAMITIDMKEKKLTVVGEICHTEILTVGPAKEEKKKEEPKKEEKKEEPKKEEAKKEEPKKEEAKKEEDPKKKPEEQMAELMKAYRAHNQYHNFATHQVVGIEENPNACVIC